MTLDYKKCNHCEEEPGSCISCASNPLKNQGETNMIDLDKRFDEALGRPEREILDEKDFWKEEEILKGKKRRAEISLTENQKRLADEACEIKTEKVDKSLDETVAEAFL